ncbi:Ribonuclease S-4 [Linum grandiflorum]
MSNMQVLGLVIMMMELATSVTFDYYKLALQWPPEVCATGRCPPDPPIPQLFTIHGLWPSNWPPNEDLVSIGLPSNAWSIEDVQKELMNPPAPSADMLTVMWPPLYEPTNPWPLWSWEWNNHGTASNFARPIFSIVNPSFLSIKLHPGEIKTSRYRTKQ